MIRSLVAAVGRWLTGGGAKALAEAYASLENAQTERERIEANVRIATIQTQQKNRELGGMVTAIMQALWAAPFVIYNWKLVVIDKVLSAGSTDGLSEELLKTQMIMVSFYFGGTVATGLVRAIRR